MAASINAVIGKLIPLSLLATAHYGSGLHQPDSLLTTPAAALIGHPLTSPNDALMAQLMHHPASLSFDTHRRQAVSVMSSTLDPQIKLSIPTNAIGNKLRAAVEMANLQATVISSTPLMAKGAQSSGQFKWLLSSGQQQFSIIAKSPLVAGSQIELKLAEQNPAVLLVRVIEEKQPPQRPPGNPETTQLSAPKLSHSAGNIIAPVKTHTGEGIARLISATDKHDPAAARHIIRQGLREALPQQQPVRQLVLLLQQVTQQIPRQQAPELIQRLEQLQRQFPNAEQMQHPAPVKQAIENSGVFLESKLVRFAMAKLSAALSAVPKPSAEPNVLSTGRELQSDVKLSSHALIELINKLTAVKQTAQTSTSNASAELNNPVDESLLVYTNKPTISANKAHSLQSSSDNNLDIMLRQLSRQLLATIARTQLNQLESVANRQSNSADNQGPVNSWVTEIPIVHGRQVDNLVLRIDQYSPEESNKQQEQTKKLWTVMLAFDLHTLGKMNVQLKILDQSVSATVWSAHEQTHTQVQRHINMLTNNLQKIGVTVKHVECQLGLPPEHKCPLYQQLVDVRT